MLSKRRCHQFPRVTGLRVFKYGRGVASLNNIAALHHGHLVAERADDFQIVADEQIGQAVAVR